MKLPLLILSCAAYSLSVKEFSQHLRSLKSHQWLGSEFHHQEEAQENKSSEPNAETRSVPASEQDQQSSQVSGGSSLQDPIVEGAQQQLKKFMEGLKKMNEMLAEPIEGYQFEVKDEEAPAN